MLINLRILIPLLLTARLAFAQASDAPKLSADDRAFTASKVQSLVQGYFFPAKDPPASELDASYKTYLRAALASDDRRECDLATIEFVTQFHNGGLAQL